jgi:dinuclear metal center YbgI/SA1388 family protein
MIALSELVPYLDDYLDIRRVPDWKDAHNGLQVDGRDSVNRIAVAVDACLATISQTCAAGADLLIVHHGLFWGNTAPVTGAYYRRLATLIKNDVALYSCHTPLDAHAEVGNNHVLLRRLGLTAAGRFGEMESVPLGVWAETDESRGDFVARVAEVLGVTPLVIAAGPERVARVGIITGGAGSWIDRAAAAGLDTFLTGEGAHHTYFEAEERGLNVLYAGHYATETLGVRALAEHLTHRFGVETMFLDHPTGL